MKSHKISASHPALAGHFPGQPVVPGVVLLDQVLGAARERFPKLQIHGITKVKFAQQLLPEQTFSIELDTPAEDSLPFRCVQDGKLIAQGRLDVIGGA